MKLISIVLKLLLVLAIQSTLVKVIGINGVGPDLVMVVIVYIALKHGAVVAVFSGLAAGLTEDVYGPIEYMGAATLSKATIGYVTGQLDEAFLKLDFVAKISLLGVVFFLGDFIYLLAIGMDRDLITNFFINRSLPEGLYTIFIGSVFFYLINPKKERNAS